VVYKEHIIPLCNCYEVYSQLCYFFFFQAEDGIRDFHVTGVQTCALPIYDPYGELRYAGEPLPGLLQLGRKVGATVVRLGTFSKVLAPGLRLGYIVAPRPIIAKLVQIKQATDLHTATVSQMAVYETIQDGFLERHLPKVRDLYKQQCGYMLDAMEEHFPKTASWTRPEGGMFIWVTLPEHIDGAR